ncbi:cyclin-like protein [Suillus cothurnatus]|nr:cyclin-like protein [Suillus cothurnatus]
MAFAQPFPLAAAAAQKIQQPAFGPDLAVRLICPECRDPNPNIVEEFGSGDLVCGSCGLVLGDRIPIVCFIVAITLHLSFSRSERNLLTAFRDIGSWCDQFSLPKTISDIAKQLYKRSDEEKLLRGKPLEAVIAACIFIACRQAHVPRTFREICNLTHVSKKTLGQCYKALEQAFNLSPGATAQVNANGSNPSTGPENLLVRYCNHLDLPANVQSICGDIIVAARQHGVADGRSPVSIAGGAIYFTCHLLGKPKSSRDISVVAGVSEGTIKLVYRLYYLEKEKLVKDEWIKEGRADLDRLPVER